jgi:hypothetical protein
MPSFRFAKLALQFRRLQQILATSGTAFGNPLDLTQRFLAGIPLRHPSNIAGKLAGEQYVFTILNRRQHQWNGGAAIRLWRFQMRACRTHGG